MPGELVNRIEHRCQIKILHHFGVAGQMARQNADLRPRPQRLAQHGAFLGDGHKKPARPGGGKRPADAVRAQAIGIGLYDGCSLRGSVRQPVKRAPVGGDGVKVDGKGRGCHVEPCFDRWAEDVKRKAGCAPKAAASAPERARQTRTALRSSAGAARQG